MPVALGFGIGTPEAAAAAAAAGADGVIVGSRLVRAAAEAPEPASPRCGELVARSSPRRAAGRIARAMGLLLTTIAGLVVWIVLWAIGVKSFDAFMITVRDDRLAATAHVFAPGAPGRPRRRRAGERLEPTLTRR